MQENDTNNNFQLASPPKVPSPYVKETVSLTESTSNICPIKPIPNEDVPKLEPQRDYFLPHTVLKPFCYTPPTVESEKFIEEKNPLLYANVISQETKLSVLNTEITLKDETVKAKSLSSEEKTIKEEQKAEKQKPFTCEDCGKSFSQLRNYKYHR